MKDFSEPYNGSISTHVLFLFSLHLDLRQVGTATWSKIHCYYDSYNEVVIPTSPQLESHLLQTQLFLDPETHPVWFCLLLMDAQISGPERQRLRKGLP